MKQQQQNPAFVFFLTLISICTWIINSQSSFQLLENYVPPKPVGTKIKFAFMFGDVGKLFEKLAGMFCLKGTCRCVVWLTNPSSFGCQTNKLLGPPLPPWVSSSIRYLRQENHGWPPCFMSNICLHVSSEATSGDGRCLFINLEPVTHHVVKITGNLVPWLQILHSDALEMQTISLHSTIQNNSQKTNYFWH